MDTAFVLQNLTRGERALIVDIIEDEYNDGRGIEGTPWSWSVVDGSKSRAAILGSLTKKGVVWTQDSGRDAVCGFTEEGKIVAAAVYADEVPAPGITPTDVPPTVETEPTGPAFHVTVGRFGQLGFGL